MLFLTLGSEEKLVKVESHNRLYENNGNTSSFVSARHCLLYLQCFMRWWSCKQTLSCWLINPHQQYPYVPVQIRLCGRPQAQTNCLLHWMCFSEMSTRPSWSCWWWLMPWRRPVPRTSSGSFRTFLTASSARWGREGPLSASCSHPCWLKLVWTVL